MVLARLLHKLWAAMGDDESSWKGREVGRNGRDAEVCWRSRAALREEREENEVLEVSSCSCATVEKEH